MNIWLRTRLYKGSLLTCGPAWESAPSTSQLSQDTYFEQLLQGTPQKFAVYDWGCSEAAQPPYNSMFCVCVCLCVSCCLFFPQISLVFLITRWFLADKQQVNTGEDAEPKLGIEGYY